MGLTVAEEGEGEGREGREARGGGGVASVVGGGGGSTAGKALPFPPSLTPPPPPPPADSRDRSRSLLAAFRIRYPVISVE